LNVTNEDGEPIGVVKDVLKYPANDVYVIESNGKELLLPAVKEFVKKIDVDAKTMKVKLIDGMLE
jgi:16S rRNA processing protein RimM